MTMIKKFTQSILLATVAISSAAFADQPILDRYFDETLPSYQFKTLQTNQRYTDPDFIPTNLSSMNDAQKLLDQLKYRKNAHAECYQRAHLWALQMRQMAQIRSQKVFLFFSDRYRRNTGFDWWFHVAPFVLVNGKEMVLDPYFFKYPVDLKTWSDHFLKEHKECVTVSTFSEYENRTKEEDCFFRKVPQFYYQPLDLENRDAGGAPINEWIDEQVISSYESLLPWWKR